MASVKSERVLIDVQIECANTARAHVVEKAIRHIVRMEGARFEIVLYRPAKTLTLWERLCGWLGMTTYHREDV
jgi:hypothetical protein